MKYFKKLNEDGTIERLDACDVNVSEGVEISKEEYKQLLSQYRPVAMSQEPVFDEIGVEL